MTEDKPRKKRRRKKAQRRDVQPAPRPLDRAPQVDLSASMEELDRRVFAAVDAVAGALSGRVAKSLSMSELHLLTTQVHLLHAMKSTHRSIRHLVARQEADLDLTVDALPLTRVQLERCFLALLLADNPARWYARYRKNAWKAFAEKFFRDQRIVGHLPTYQGYFGSSGEGVSAMRAFARQMDVAEDELQTLRMQVACDDEPDPRWQRRFIPDMPAPGRCAAELADPDRKRLAELLYPYYNNLSHFSHGGMVGVMQAAILRPGDSPAAQVDFDKERFWSSAVVETTLPLSYVAALFVATLLATGLADQHDIRPPLIEAWRPYLCDGLPLGIAIWDAWAARALGADAT